MSTPPRSRMTVEEYLALEASTQVRHEYLDGEVFAMGGASFAHNIIVRNMLVALHQRLRNGPCRAIATDLRTRVGASGLYTYPDLVVVCGKPELDRPGDTLTNPTVLVEVLSESTERYDRGEKFRQYRMIPSLTGYLLISQDLAQVEYFAREPDGTWRYRAWMDMNDVIELQGIDCSVPLSEVYPDVEFPPPPQPTPPD